MTDEFTWFQRAEISDLQVLGFGDDVVVAVVDTGLDMSQSDLVKNLWPGMQKKRSDISDWYYSDCNLGDRDSKNIQDLSNHSGVSMC